MFVAFCREADVEPAPRKKRQKIPEDPSVNPYARIKAVSSRWCYGARGEHNRDAAPPPSRPNVLSLFFVYISRTC